MLVSYGPGLFPSLCGNWLFSLYLACHWLVIFSKRILLAVGFTAARDYSYPLGYHSMLVYEREKVHVNCSSAVFDFMQLCYW